MNENKESYKNNKELITVSKKAGKAIIDYGMIDDGNRIAVAVSGGKDSLSLLHVLRHRQSISPIRFELVAVHIDFEFSDFNPEILINYLKEEGFNYIVKKISDLKGEKYEEIDCFRWSKHRRKALFQICNAENFNKIAFGHHLDDIAETIILNQFYRGEIGAMKPVQELFKGLITIIRPLTYVREQEMVMLAKRLGIHTMGQSKCANDDNSQRMFIKKMLREFESNRPGIVKNIFTSLENIQEDYLPRKVTSGENYHQIANRSILQLKIQKILNFWFQSVTDEDQIKTNEVPASRWFKKDDAFDEEIRRLFEYDVLKAKSGKYDEWKKDEKGVLALIILLDQFTRNIYRNNPRSYESDQKAQQLTQMMIKEGWDQKLSCIERVFIYMPLMHAEDLTVQQESVRLFELLVEQSKNTCPQNTSYFEYNLKYAKEHYQSIKEHGRFPSRDKVLGRSV